MMAFTQEVRSLVPVGMRVGQFTGQRVLCLAVEKLFINLGEAATGIGDDVQRFPDIPWRRIIGLRNILAHGYEQVSHEIPYETIVQALPSLEELLSASLQSLTPGE